MPLLTPSCHGKQGLNVPCAAILDATFFLAGRPMKAPRLPSDRERAWLAPPDLFVAPYTSAGTQVRHELTRDSDRAPGSTT